MFQLSDSEESRALKLHETSIVVDAHSDLPFDLARRAHLQHSPMKSFHLPRLQAGGVDVVVCALTWDGTVYTGELKRALKSLDLVLSEVKENSTAVVIAKTVADIYQAKKAGKILKKELISFLSQWALIRFETKSLTWTWLFYLKSHMGL